MIFGQGQPTSRSQAATISKESTITFSHVEAKVAKFDIAVKQLKVNIGLSFEQTIVGLFPRCYIPNKYIKLGAFKSS